MYIYIIQTIFWPENKCLSLPFQFFLMNLQKLKTYMYLICFKLNFLDVSLPKSWKPGILFHVVTYINKPPVFKGHLGFSWPKSWKPGIPAHVVTSIKQPPILKGDIFLFCQRRFHMNLTLFKRSPLLSGHVFFVPKVTS